MKVEPALNKQRRISGFQLEICTVNSVSNIEIRDGEDYPNYLPTNAEMHLFVL